MTIKTPWRAVSAMFFLNGILIGAWGARIPSFVQEFSLSPLALGLLLLCIALGALAGFPFAGRLADERGAAKSSLMLAVVYIVALMLLPFAPNVAILAAGLAFFGFAHGAQDVTMNAWAAEVEKHMGRAVMSSFHAVWSMGAAVGALSGLAAIRFGLSPDVHFPLLAVVSGLIFVPLGMIDWQSPRNIAASGPRFALPKGALLLVGLVGFSTTFGEGAMLDWSALVLIDAKGVAEHHAPLGYFVFGAAMVATRLSGSLIVQWIGPVAAVRLSGLSACVGGIIVLFSPTLPLALIGFVFFGLGYAMIVPLAFSRAANDPEIPPGRAIASVALLSYSGILVGPPVIGFVAQMTSLNGSLMLLVGLGVVTAMLAPTLRQ